MRSRIFELEKENLGRFFTLVEKEGLTVELIEVNEHGSLEVQIDYTEDERDAVMSLMEFIDDINEQEESESEEEESQEESEDDAHEMTRPDLSSWKHLMEGTPKTKKPPQKKKK
jgi:hypothetical protein